MILTKILKDSNYRLDQFSQNEIDKFEKSIFLKEVKSQQVPYIKCLVRNKDIKLTPEEVVRQLFLMVLINRYGYPISRIQIEYSVTFGKEKKRADIVIFEKNHPDSPYIIVELKKPKLKDGKEQLKSYCNATGAPIGVWSNGESISYYHRKDPNYFEDITNIPTETQKLSDVLNEKFTLDDLIKTDKLVNERKSLKSLILEMEDEVLANAGVDVFEDVFKLIFSKLYDEWLSGKNRTRLLEFRNSGQTDAELKEKIQKLFDNAKTQWEGVFTTDSKIMLTPSHLSVCVSSLQNVKLFNSNLDVVDEAFEYLISKSSKGEKGQYFTPRYVIDMCVKMLNPKENEYLIDTACGSAGFTVHGIFHVWKQIIKDEGLNVSNLFTIEKKPYRCEQYVQNKVFAIDFDEKSVRVARTLNLIAGDGQTNALHLNTLDYERWNEVTKEEDWNDTYNEGFKKLKKIAKNKESFKEFNFDVLLANPPFAGDIKESRILSKYELSKNVNGKWQNKVGRDILFIERNLDFLKPGGRMAIVLPQGRFNNASDQYIRNFINEHCRILAVVGLHQNTFKPHTGTKTSVLFVQKWNDDIDKGPICKKVDDYNIFFATMQKSGKDNSGEKIFVKTKKTLNMINKDNWSDDIIPKLGELENSDATIVSEFLLDEHGHLIVDHDLFNHEGLTQDGIAEAFIEFAKKEHLSFFDLCPSVQVFDRKKYEQLMDGLEAVEIKFSKLEKTARIDSEVYQKIYNYIDSAIKNHKYTSIGNEVETIKKGIFDIKAECYIMSKCSIDKAVPFVRISNLKNMLIDDTDIVFIPNEENEKNISTFLEKGDIILSKTATPAASIVNIDYCNTSQDTVAIKLKPTSIVNSHYLVVFLNCKYGYYQMKKWFTGNIQMHLNLADSKDIIVPLMSKNFQEKIKDIFEKGISARTDADIIYKSAEDCLMSKLDLNTEECMNLGITVKSIKKSFLETGRLDPEYYHPKYDVLIEKIFCNAKYVKQIKDFQIYNARGLQPVYYENGDLDIINSKHILEQHLDYENFEKTDLKYWNFQAKAQILKSDILIYTTGANIGRTNIYLSDNKALASNHVNILRIKNENPYYVSFVLNSKIGRLQTEKLSAGSAQQELYPKDIDTFFIPFVDITTQDIIQKAILDSFESRIKSNQLFDIAKIGLEKAIEQNEDIATTWINSELIKIGIIM